MTTAFKSWLPEEALRGGAVERSIRDPAHIWSERWFARQFVRLLDTAGHPAGRPRDLGASWTCRTHPEGLSIALTEASGLAVAGLMLDRTINRNDLNSADKVLLERLVSHCISDFCDLLGDAFRLKRDGWQSSTCVPSTQQDAQFYRLGLSAGSPLLHVGVDPSAAVAVVKATASATQSASPLSSVEAALKEQQIQISARLGECNISVADLVGLAIGDVLVLDRDLQGSAEIAIDGKQSKGRCTIEHSAGKLQLKIQKSVTG